ncbi:MAG: methyltransferase domain-containing protein [Fibrobacteres bacterium]|nr:methyltransferase domain-containing protein [Fibrobacterota bacterium]
MKRSQQPELMDDPSSDLQALRETLEGFRLINRLFSRMGSLTEKYICKDILKRGLKCVTIVDLGAGSGELCIDFIKWCRKQNINVKAICIDLDSRVVEFGKEYTADYKEIVFIEANALAVDLSEFKPDYIVSNHFLHHLSDDEIVYVLKQSFKAARFAVLFNDLQRSRIAYILYTIVIRLFYNKGFLYEDGRLSIKRGFNVEELKTIINSAKLKGSMNVGSMLPFRVYLHSNQ